MSGVLESGNKKRKVHNHFGCQFTIFKLNTHITVPSQLTELASGKVSFLKFQILHVILGKIVVDWLLIVVANSSRAFPVTN